MKKRDSYLKKEVCIVEDRPFNGKKNPNTQKYGLRLYLMISKFKI